LGYEPKSETLIDEPFVKVTTSQTLCYQLQPVVFTSYDIYSYYTDATDPIRFTNEEVLRFGRSDNTSMNWLGEHRAVVVQDDERTVSRMHAELRHVKGKGWFLFDMGTPNGTTVFRAYGGGVVYCSRESDEVERCIRINTGDVFFLGPSATSRKEAPGRAFVDIGARNKAFRFERVIE
jgi:pSer/pThr/pTyr-binding forkhead associated (FHA) protein